MLQKYQQQNNQLNIHTERLSVILSRVESSSLLVIQ